MCKPKVGKRFSHGASELSGCVAARPQLPGGYSLLVQCQGHGALALHPMQLNPWRKKSVLAAVSECVSSQFGRTCSLKAAVVAAVLLLQVAQRQLDSDQDASWHRQQQDCEACIQPLQPVHRHWLVTGAAALTACRE